MFLNINIKIIYSTDLKVTGSNSKLTFNTMLKITKEKIKVTHGLDKST